MEPTRQESRTPADDAESLIQDMLDRWEDAWESGEELSAETLCAERPELQTALAERIDELKKIDGFIGRTDTVGKVDTEPSPDQTADLPPAFGQFEILDRIAQGGMGAVYRAQQKSPSRVVALKVIRSGDLSSQKEIDRFFAEANAAANLSHPNIVPVFEVGEENGRHYFTMEYVKGRTLAQIVRSDGPMVPKKAAELMSAIAEAVHYAHDKGVIHRDIKPANVIVDEADRPRVTDFGIAKQLEVDTALTATGQILGTPEYMSPEQAKGQQSEIDRRSDVFSLGATLYAMLTGRSPFRDEEIYATLQNVIEKDPTSPRKLQPKIDKDLETICLKCLRKKSGDRYATAQELADDLQRYLAGTTITARRTPLPVRASRWIKRHPAIAVLSLLACAGLVWGGFELAHYINYERITTKYYMNVEDRRHVRVGVGEITEEQARQRQSSWKIVRRGRKGRVLSASRINWLLKPVAFTAELARSGSSPNECRWEYEYHSDGRVHKEHCYNYSGKRVWSFVFTSEDRGHFLDKWGLPRTSVGTDMVGKKIELDEAGYAKLVMSTDFRGNPRPDPEGVFGSRITRSDDGHTIESTSLGPDGEPMRHKQGYFTVRMETDANGNVVRKTFLDEKGRPTLHQDGYAVQVLDYDDLGRLTRERFFGLNDEPVLSKVGYHESRFRNTVSPPKTESLAFDTRGNPVTTNRGYHRSVLHFDDRGHYRKMRFFDADNKPALQKDGSYGIDWDVDENGLAVKMTYVGPQGNPIVGAKGYAWWTRKHDADGNRIEQRWFNAEGKPTLLKEGYAIWRRKYDRRGNEIEQRLYDTNDKLTMTSLGHARRILERDEKGNVVRDKVFDPDDEPAWKKEGYSQVRQEYDIYGRKTKIMWCRPDGRPVLTSRGFAGQSFKHDQRDNIVETRYLDARGGLTVNENGYAIVRSKFDKFNRLIERRTFDVNDRPVRTSDGIAGYSVKYDDERRILEQRNFDETGAATASLTHHSAIQRETRDSRGNIVRTEYLDADRNPTRGPAGYARSEGKFDNRGNGTEIRYFDAKGQPARGQLGEYGQQLTYDNRGNVIQYTFLGKDGRPAPTARGFTFWKREYDSRGNITKSQFLDQNGLAYVEVRYRYDQFGNRIEMTNYDRTGRKANNASGIATTKKSYDKLGRLITEAWFDRFGKPARNSLGYHGSTYKYDARGNQVENVVIGPDGKPFNLYGKFAITRRKFDAFGHTVETAFFDADGNKANHYYFQSHLGKRRFDDRGRQVENSYFDTNGNLTDGFIGWARETFRYDPDGWLIEKRYFRADGVEVFPTFYVHQNGNRAIMNRLGLKPLDILWEYDGKPIMGTLTFKARRQRTGDNEPRKLVVLRGRERKPVELMIRPHDKFPQTNASAKYPPFLLRAIGPRPVRGKLAPVAAPRPRRSPKR